MVDVGTCTFEGVCADAYPRYAVAGVPAADRLDPCEFKRGCLIATKERCLCCSLCRVLGLQPRNLVLVGRVPRYPVVGGFRVKLHWPPTVTVNISQFD